MLGSGSKVCVRNGKPADAKALSHVAKVSTRESVAAAALARISEGRARGSIARHAARAEALDPGRSPKRTWQPLAPELGEAHDDASNHTI